MLNCLVVRAAVVLALGFATATARGDPPARQAERNAVEARLRAHELPPPPSAWSGLGSGIDEVLIKIGGDSKVELLLRARAVSALGRFGTPAAQRFLEETIDRRAASSEAGDRLLVRRAAVALGWMGGFGVPARLGPLLGNPDPDIRLDAALALGLTRLPAAADLLRKRLPSEPALRVKAQIERQIRIIESASGMAKPAQH